MSGSGQASEVRNPRGAAVALLSGVLFLVLAVVAWQFLPTAARTPPKSPVNQPAPPGWNETGSLAPTVVSDGDLPEGSPEKVGENAAVGEPSLAQADGPASAATATEPAVPSDADPPAEVEPVEGDPATATAGESAPGQGSNDDLAGPRERFAVMTHGGPVLVDLVIQLEGATYDSALTRLVDEAFRVADEDGDGSASWKDVVENPRFRSGQFGNLVADNPEEQQQLIRLYDSDRDGQVDREELPRFLTRNSGGGQSFSLRSSNEYRSSNRSRSATRLLLDADVGGVRDGAITEEEMAAAPSVLQNRDADDDGVVVLAELKNSLDLLQDPQQQMMSNRRKTNEPDTAVWLSNPAVDLNRRWGMVQFLMQELYSYGQAIRSADWPLTPELFQQLDADADGELKRTEFARFVDVPPHLLIAVDFAGKSENEQPGPRIKLRSISSELAQWKPVVTESAARLSLQFPTVKLDFFVNEDPALANTVQAAKAQFTSLDQDKNGYLEASEVPEQLPGTDATFESFDADGDGKVYEAEILAYLQQRNAVARAQVRARVADQEDALFSVLDANGDGQLNTREIREAPKTLREIDRNGDGMVQSHEIPGSMVIGIVRGNSQQDAQLFAGPAVVAAPQNSSLPRWFRGMDTNADGEVSRREFFGDRDQFERLDRNGDGYILVDELPPE